MWACIRNSYIPAAPAPTIDSESELSFANPLRATHSVAANTAATDDSYDEADPILLPMLSDYKSSAWYTKFIDLSLLLTLSFLNAFIPRPSTIVLIAVKTSVSCTAQLAVCIHVLVVRPFVHGQDWKVYVRALLLVVSICCTLLSTSVFVHQSGLGSDSLAASIDVGAYIVFVLSCLAFVVLVGGFCASIYDGESILRYSCFTYSFTFVENLSILHSVGAAKEQRDIEISRVTVGHPSHHLEVHIVPSSTLAHHPNSKVVEETTLPSSVASTLDESSTVITCTVPQERDSDDACIVNPLFSAPFQVRRGLGRGGHMQRKGTIVRAMSTVAKEYLDAAQGSSSSNNGPMQTAASGTSISMTGSRLLDDASPTSPHALGALGSSTATV